MGVKDEWRSYILRYKKRIQIFEEFIIVFQTDGCVNIYNGDTHGVVMNMVQRGRGSQA